MPILKPIARGVWALKGPRPRSRGRTRYQWLYLYGFVRPKTGNTFGVLLPRVRADRMGEALAAFAAHADPDGQKALVVLVDNAGWHKAKALVVPANVVLHFLPRVPRSCSRPSRSGRWSARPWRTARSAASTGCGTSSATG